MSLLSIIIPHHNTPDLLQRCLDSIPDIEDIQVLVVDDNSDANFVSFENFPGLSKINTEVYLTKEGRGAGYARNVGLQHAKGDWLLFADSDDFFVQGFYDVVGKYFDTNVDMVLFKAKSVVSETLEPSNRNENINKCIDDVCDGKIDAAHASISVQSPWCRLIKRNFVENNNILFDEVMSCNDAMFTTKCTCLAKTIKVSQDYLYVITHREGSLWDNRKKNPKNFLTRMEVQINRNNYVKKYGYNQLPILGYVIKSASFGLGTFISALGISLKRGAIFQGISNYFKG